MRTKHDLPPPETPPDSNDIPVESERDQISQNIEAVLDFYTREDHKISCSQRVMERIAVLSDSRFLLALFCSLLHSGYSSM
jgi:hypothetical protein